MSDQGGNGGAAAAAGGEGGGDNGAAAAAAAAAAGGGNNNGGGDGGGGEGGAAFALPEAYKDAAWAKDFKSADDVWKSLANAQQFVGRPKYGIPGETATAEERAGFYKSLGVPEDAKEYGITRPENLPAEQWDENSATKWAGIMKAQNLTKTQGQELFKAIATEEAEREVAGTKALNEAMTKSFGDKSVEISKRVGDMMTKAIPDAALRQQIQAAVGNKNTPAFALALGHVLQHMEKTYGLSDTNTDDSGQGSGKSVKELRDEAQKLMASEAYRDAMHKDHKETRKQVDGMYADIGRLTDAEKASKKK